VAWRSNDRIWVSATSPQNIARQLYEIDLRGRLRLVREVPGEITVHDVAPDGSMLLTINDRRILLQAITDGQGRDLSWLDRSIFGAFSADGSSILFHEGGEGGGVLGTTHLRKLDGSPPVRLSEGYSIDISPDQKWVLVYVPLAPTQYRLVPTGAGTAKVITTPDVPQAFPFGFAREGSRILWVGADRNGRRQMFNTALDGSDVRLVAPAGVAPLLFSHNGKYAVVRREGRLQIWEAGQNTWIPVPPLERSDLILGLSDDGQSLYVARARATGPEIVRIRVQNGVVDHLADVPVVDRSGMLAIVRLAITPDEKTIIVNYVRHTSELYLMQLHE